MLFIEGKMKKEVFKEIIMNRRSIRKFKELAVKDEDIELLLQYGMSGPSACLRKPWKFYVVTNETMLEKLRHVTRFSNMNGRCAIIVCGDLNKALPREMETYWIQDCSSAMENMLLGAESLDLGACWIGIYPQEKGVNRMREILSMPNEIVPLGMMWLGYKDEEKNPNTYYNKDDVIYIK